MLDIQPKVSCAEKKHCSIFGNPKRKNSKKREVRTESRLAAASDSFEKVANAKKRDKSGHTEWIK